MKRYTRFILVLSVMCANSIHAWSQVTINADYTASSHAKNLIDYNLNVYNRITPINGFNAPHAKEDTKLCIVRPLGGIARRGKADIAKDSYRWDADKKEFYTDFSLLKKQIDGVFQEGLGIYQIVLDNPSWAFQRDENGNLLGDTLKVSTYGNAEPPRNYNAWTSYLRELMNFLLKTYGEDQVLNIQYGVGREIGTPTHWSGTKEQFFEFYKVSTEAIHAVVPRAKVGTHLLWGSSKKAWGADFVKWAKANNIHYDFVGVSFYPFYDKPERTDLSKLYPLDFGCIKDIPEWNENAKLEMHEYALIETLSKAGNAFKSADQAHQNSFMVGMMKMYFEHGMQHVFQWGDGRKYQPASTILKSLKGQRYYSSTKTGSQVSDANYVDAIFSKDTGQKHYSIMAYSYSAKPDIDVIENLKLQALFSHEPGTLVKYRVAFYGSMHPELKWTEWQKTTTKKSEEEGSILNFDVKLPSFSILKYDIKVLDDK